MSRKLTIPQFDIVVHENRSVDEQYLVKTCSRQEPPPNTHTHTFTQCEVFSAQSSHELKPENLKQLFHSPKKGALRTMCEKKSIYNAFEELVCSVGQVSFKATSTLRPDQAQRSGPEIRPTVCFLGCSVSEEEDQLPVSQRGRAAELLLRLSKTVHL